MLNLIYSFNHNGVSNFPDIKAMYHSPNKVEEWSDPCSPTKIVVLNCPICEVVDNVHSTNNMVHIPIADRGGIVFYDSNEVEFEFVGGDIARENRAIFTKKV